LRIRNRSDLAVGIAGSVKSHKAWTASYPGISKCNIKAAGIVGHGVYATPHLIPIGNVDRFDQDICPGFSEPMGSLFKAVLVKIE
jgi:hypothetical protein